MEGALAALTLDTTANGTFIRTGGTARQGTFGGITVAFKGTLNDAIRGVNVTATSIGALAVTTTS